MTDESKVSLRPFRKEDRQALARLANNILIWNNVRDRLPHPYTQQHADDFIAYCRRLSPTSVLAIAVNDELAGCIGIELQDDIYRLNAELGYWLGEPYWGKGVTTEALRQFLDYVAQAFPHLLRIYAGVFEYNLPSMRVLEKNGFELEVIRRQAVIKNDRLLDDHVYVKFNAVSK